MSLFSRVSTSVNTTPPTRITLVDNTAPPAPASEAHSRSQSPSSDGSQQQSRNSLGDGKRETLRRAIAERRYKRWSVNSGSADTTEGEDNLEEALDERAQGVVAEREFTDGVKRGGDAGKANGDGANDGGAGGSRRGRNKGQTSNGVGGTGQTRRNGGGKTEIAEIDVLYENQRGIFVCGFPLFSSKSLLNFDPSAWQNTHFHNSAVSILDAQVPDPSWVWDWKSWYVDMTGDVDEEGWAYSFSFSPAFAWHGNHVWFHSFVRRRRWLRKRVKLPTQKNGTGPVGDYGSRTGSVEKAGHRLNNDYFTIHSRRERDSWHVRWSHKRKSVIEGSDWGGDDESDEEVEIKDIPSLMNVVRKARLDREKIEAVLWFAEEGGEEITYLAEKISTIMSWMVFQASRRQLLAHLIDYSEQYEAGMAPTITIVGPPSPPVDQDSTATLDFTTSEQPLTKPGSDPSKSSPSAQVGVVEGKNPDEDDPEARSRKIENLRKAIHTADQEVKKMEFWSDIKDVARKGESVTAEGGWNDLGISGASVGNEKVFGGAGHGGVPEERERVDIKGKGKAVQR